MAAKRFGPFPGVITQDNGNINPLVNHVVEWEGLTPQEDWTKRASTILTFMSKFMDREMLTTPCNRNEQVWDEKLLEMLECDDPYDRTCGLHFDFQFPNVDIWTRDGKVTRMYIHRPTDPSNYNNLNYWLVYLYCDWHTPHPVIKDAASLMLEERYLLAWYALCKRLPMEYKAWKWAAGWKEVVDPSIPPNASFWYQAMYEDWEALVKFKRIPREDWVVHYPNME